MPKYRQVVFLQDPAEFDKWYVEYDENRDAGFSYLLQWEYGDDIPLTDESGWGSSDQIEYFSNGDLSYAVTYNWHMSYVGLTEIVEG